MQPRHIKTQTWTTSATDTSATINYYKQASKRYGYVHVYIFMSPPFIYESVVPVLLLLKKNVPEIAPTGTNHITVKCIVCADRMLRYTTSLQR